MLEYLIIHSLMQKALWLLWFIPWAGWPWPFNRSMVIFIFMTKSYTSLFEMKFDKVSRTLYLVKSATEKLTPLVTKLAIALLNTFIEKSS